MLILYFHSFQRGLDVLNAILQASVCVTILTPFCITICTTVSKFLKILLVVELLIKIFYHLAEEKLFIYLLYWLYKKCAKNNEKSTIVCNCKQTCRLYTGVTCMFSFPLISIYFFTIETNNFLIQRPTER